LLRACSAPWVDVGIFFKIARLQAFQDLRSRDARTRHCLEIPRTSPWISICYPAFVVRKMIRLQNFDYSANGAYFITICTDRRRGLLTGSGVDIARREFLALPDRFAGLTLDSRKFMPDHLHLILQLNDCGSTLSTIVQAYKSITTLAIKRRVTCGRVWQRGFYDRVIRDEVELAALREYIEHNDIVHAVRRGAGSGGGASSRGGASSAPTDRDQDAEP
jgi:putative transposase